MSETPDTPSKPETPEVSTTPAGKEATAEADVTVSPDKPAKTEAQAQAVTAEKVETTAAPDKPDKTETPTKPEQAGKPDPVKNKAALVKDDPSSNAVPAAAKATKTDATDKPAKATKTDATDKPAKPAKPAPKPKPEDKPFTNFIHEDLLPSLTKSLTAREQAPISLTLVEGERPVVGGRCWMVQGELPSERRFWLCFEADAITSGKTIALAESGSDPSLLESFLIDEKRINLALLESRLLQRLNGQKWFGGN